MERKISEAKHKFLANESSKWVDDGIISAEARGGILSSYTTVRRLPTMIWALGLTMIGLGVLSFIAANWNALGRTVKIVMIVGLYAASVGGACHFERKGRKTASELLMFVSGYFLLGGIALMSQAFHISGDIGDLLVTWLIVYLPTFLIVRNLSVFVLYEIVTLFYVNIAFFRYMEDLRYERYGLENSAVLLVGPYGPLLLTLLLSGAAWWMWYERRKLSRASSEPWVRYFFVGGSTRRIFFSNFLILNWFTWICVINSRHESLLPYVLGVLTIGALILFMAKRLDAADLEWQGLLIVGAAGLALTFPFVWHFASVDYDRYIEGALSAPLLASVLLGVYLVSRIIRRRWGGGFSTFLFCVLLARWYFDLFYTFMDTAIFFISGGAFMLVVAYGYRRWNKLAGPPQAADRGGDGDEESE
ncbi:MAG: DUF2157 domain-containing protein [Synergistaceae bacterium]|nr:DUF2157 domain-containing protein [Synergistaceae bacterium]